MQMVQDQCRGDTSWDTKLLRLYNPTSRYRIDMEIQPMEHNEMLTTWKPNVNTNGLREYGPLGHNYSPWGNKPPEFKHEPNWLGIHDPVMDSFYPRALAATTEDELNRSRKKSRRAARQHYVVCLLQPMSMYSINVA